MVKGGEKMPECANCGKQWSWKETTKSSFTLDTGMICPHCGKKQFVTAKSRKWMMIPMFLIPLPLMLTAFFDLTVYAAVILYLTVIALIFILMPRLTRLANEEIF